MLVHVAVGVAETLGDVVRLGESLGDSLGDVEIVASSVVWSVVVGEACSVVCVVGLGESLGDVDAVGRAHTQLNLHRHAPAPVL